MMSTPLQQIVKERTFEYKPEAPPVDKKLVMSDAAFIGIAGHFVDSMHPITEADRVALLGHYIGYFGNLIGRSASILVEGHMHYPNMFIGLIGESSKGRKGTAGQSKSSIKLSQSILKQT
jgi:hypothetical protein